jgi:peptidoglycan-associated lipoprotein
MRKKYLIAVLFVAACALMTAGCSKQLTKGDGGAPAQNVSSVEKQNMDNKNINSTGQQNGNAEKAELKNAGETSSETLKGKGDLEDIHFDFDKYNILQNDRTILSRDAAYLLKHKRVGIVIEGNCDERGTAEYNMALGEKRADEAKNYLVNLGVESKRIKTVSYGSEKPLNSGHDEAAWAQNRRDHFAVN